MGRNGKVGSFMAIGLTSAQLPSFMLPSRFWASVFPFTWSYCFLSGITGLMTFISPVYSSPQKFVICFTCFTFYDSLCVGFH